MNKKSIHISDRQLFDYLNNTASESETRQVESWIQQNKNNKSYFIKFKKAFDSADAYPMYRSIDVDRKLEEFLLLANKHQNGKVRFLQSNWLKIAASVLLIVASGFLIYNYFSSETITYEYADSDSPVLLPDSSMVYLQPGAKLTTNKRFNREVHFAGEAFFNIHKNSNKPFTVELKNSRVQVLGTSFNINSESEVEVKLYEGKIRFLSKAEPVTLEPGDEIIYNSANESVITKPFHEVEAELQFNGVEFKEVCKLLEKKYLYKIQLSSVIANEKVTGQFASGESISDILQILSKTLEFDYTINNRHIAIETETVKNKSPDDYN